MNCTPLFMSDFYAHLRTNGIMVYSVEGCGNVFLTYSRRAFYKISLLSGTGIVNYEDRSIKINGSVLLITKPGRCCKWRLLTTNAPSYTCVITREFLTSRCFNWVNRCNLFSLNDPEVYNLSYEESRFLGTIFQKMIGSQHSVYPFRSELVQDQICVLLHTALSMKPSEDFVDSASTTIIPMSQHVELAEMQFPSEVQVLHFN